MPTATTQSHERREQGRLPGWGDLVGRSDAGAEREEGFLARLSTVRFALAVLTIAGGCALYVGHVHATQQLLSQVQEARQENRRLHLKERRLQSAFDQATAPSVIYRRAEKLGLEEGLPGGPTILLDAQPTPQQPR